MKRETYISKIDFYKGRYGARKCGFCGKDLPTRRRFWCSDECVMKIQAEGQSWQAKRWLCFVRDKFTCQMCGYKAHMCDMDEHGNTILACDHIIPVEIAPEKQWDSDNHQTLCIKCHKKKTAQDMKAIALSRRGLGALSFYQGKQTRLF